MLTAESFLIRRFKLNPFELECRCTIFDFYVFIDRLIDDINTDNEELNSGGKDSQVLKSLRYTRNVLNKLNLGD